MDDLKKIAELMKADWDRRIGRDYLFWMSDAWGSDDAMWASGERDFNIICDGLGNTRDQTLLDLGCGVGRLLKPALAGFKKVIGLDVSPKAVEKARELLAGASNLELLLGNGVDLQPIADQSVDVVLSFAALACVPVNVLANYLREFHRVLKPEGKVRLQLYLGANQAVHENDTLSLRCYVTADFEKAAGLAGFKVESLNELVLPVQTSVPEQGIIAMVVSLVRLQTEPASPNLIAGALLPGGEGVGADAASDEDLEYWMTINHAKDLYEQGEYAQALKTLESCVSYSKGVTIDVRDLLDKVVSRLKNNLSNAVQGGKAPKTASVTESPGSSQLFEKNAAVLKMRLPEQWPLIEAAQADSVGGALEVRDSQDGPVIYLLGQCQDHPEKPSASARAWVQRTLHEARFKSCNHIVVYGFGCGYHVEALLSQSGCAVSVIEPSAAVMRAALAARDLTQCLEKLKTLTVGEHENLTCFDEQSELAVRPQTQAVAPAYLKQVRAKCYGTRGFTTLHPQIAVLGPIQGGTLPIMTYTANALTLLRQRARVMDVSGFAGGYHAVEKFLNNDLMRVNGQGAYVEMLSKYVLDSVTEKPVDILICMALAPLTANTLTELRKRGIITVLWFVEDFKRFKTWNVLAPYYDFIFTIQRGECIEAIKAAGCSEVHYLPTGLDPFIHAPVQLSAEEQQRWGSDVSFVGAGYYNRQQMFAALADEPFKIWGTEWPDCRPFDRMVQEQGRRLKPEEYIKIFNATKINLNLHSSTERDGVEPGGDFINPRTFELAGCGAFQLVDPRTLLGEVFTAGRDLVTFENTEDLKDKIHYYLAHPEERGQIARQGRETALRYHTYQHRIKEMLSVIYSSRLEHLKRREDTGPWRKILDRSRRFPELHERCQAAYERGEEPGLDGLVSDIVLGKGSLSETEQRLLFLFHVSKSIIRMKKEEMGEKG